MSVQLQLEITLDSKGAVSGVKTLDTAIGGLDKTTQGADKSGGSLFKTIFAGSLAANAASRAISAMTGFVKDSFGAFLESEAVQADMIQTMTGLGIATEENIAKFTGLADEILRTTTIDDEAAKSMIKLGLSMGVTSDRIEEAVKGAIGLSKAFGMDAQSAMKGVSAAMEGNFALLGRYIPALASAKTEQEKWALVQAAMEGGFKRETASINTSLGAWKQFQNQIGEAKEAVGGFLVGALKWLYDARAAIAAAALAMGTLFVVGNISAWYTAISGALSSMIAQLGTANTAALTLKLSLGQIAAVGATAFVGWQIGRLIGEITGLDNAMQDYFERLIQTSFLYKGSTAELSDYSKAHAEAAKTARAGRDAVRKHNEVLEKAKKVIPEVSKANKVLAESFQERYEKELATAKLEEDYIAFVNAKYLPAAKTWLGLLEQMPQSQGGVNAATEAGIPIAGEYKGALDLTGKSMQDLGDWTVETADANEALSQAMSDGQKLLGQFRSALNAAGIDVGDVGNRLLDCTDSAMGFLDALTSGDPIAIIGASFQLLGDIIGAVAKLFAGDGVGEAIERENQWMQLTKQQIEQLRKLEEQYGSTHAATSDMLDQIIANADMTADSFDQWADRLRGILSDYDQGTMTLGQTTKQIGDGFTALIAKAKELGTEGSSSLLNMFDDLHARGIRVAEVEEYIAEQLGRGLDGYMKMKEAMVDSKDAQETFGNLNIKVFEDMISYQNKIEKNKGMTDAIAGATEALIGLSNATRLSETDFDGFEKSASAAFEKLTKEGFTSKETYQQLAPMLARLKFLHEEYGLTLDASTQKLLDGADAAGVNTDQAMTQEEAFERMTGALEQMVVLMGGTLPDATHTAIAALGEMTGSAIAGVDGLSEKIAKRMPDAYGEMARGAINAFDIAANAAGGMSAAIDAATVARTVHIGLIQDGEGGVIKPKPAPLIKAATGFYSPRLSSDTLIQAHAGERVNITPAAQNSGGGRTTYWNVTIKEANSPASAADNLRKALEDNTHGILTYIEGL